MSNLSKMNLANDIKNQTSLALLHLYYATFTENKFPMVKNNRIFDWKQFEKENNLFSAQKRLKELELVRK